MAKDETEIRDVWCSAFVMAMSGRKPIRLVPIGGGRCRFIFDNPNDSVWQLVMEWRNNVNGAMVSGTALREAYRELITMSRNAEYFEGDHLNEYNRY